MENSEIKICIFSPNVYPYFNSKTRAPVGGAELQFYYMGTELAKHPNFSVHIVVDAARERFEKRDGVKLYKFNAGAKNKKYLKIFNQIWRLYSLFSKINADIYLQRAASYWTGIIAFYCKLRGKKFVYMIAHNGDVKRELHPRRKGFLRKKMWWVYEYGLKSADLIIAQNTFQKEELKKNYGRDSVIRNSAHRIPGNTETQEKDIVFWVARGEDWKQPGAFLDLADNFADTKFVMAMPLSPRFEEFWHKTKKRAENMPNVEFIDFIPPDKIENYFARAKVFVNTSTHEGFPNTFIQAAKHKTPILSLNVDPSGILQNHKIGINAGGDFQKLKNSLETLLTDENKWRELSENAYLYVKENHDIEKIIEDDKKLLLSLVGGERS